jgi:IMP dehydrogenase/GMP reductase
MISIGANSIKELQEKAEVELISAASRTEGAVHDVEEISSRKNN